MTNDREYELNKKPTFKNHDTKVSEKVTLQFTAEHNEDGERLCTCGSGIPWMQCPGLPHLGDNAKDFCG